MVKKTIAMTLALIILFSVSLVGFGGSSVSATSGNVLYNSKFGVYELVYYAGDNVMASCFTALRATKPIVYDTGRDAIHLECDGDEVDVMSEFMFKTSGSTEHYKVQNTNYRYMAITYKASKVSAFQIYYYVNGNNVGRGDGVKLIICHRRLPNDM